MFQKSRFSSAAEGVDEDTADEDAVQGTKTLESTFEECGTFEGFVEVGDNLPVAEDLSDDSTVRMVHEQKNNEDSATEKSESEGDCAPLLTSTSPCRYCRKFTSTYNFGQVAMKLLAFSPNWKKLLQRTV